MQSITKPTTQWSLDAPQSNDWMLVDDEDLPGRRFLRVLYEKPSGEEVEFEFEMPRQFNAKGDSDWIEQRLIGQLRERFLAEFVRVRDVRSMAQSG